jgi:hypothetical protein
VGEEGDEKEHRDKDKIDEDEDNISDDKNCA